MQGKGCVDARRACNVRIKVRLLTRLGLFPFCGFCHEVSADGHTVACTRVYIEMYITRTTDYEMPLSARRLGSYSTPGLPPYPLTHG